MNPNIVAGLINRVYTNFDMFSFDNRLKLQKFTYFLEYVFDLNIGYEFEWYLYGPYSIELAKDGFLVNFSATPALKFDDTKTEERFKEFLNFFENKKDDKEWLEIASSVHLLKKLSPGRTDKEIIEQIRNKHENFGEKGIIIKNIIEELRMGKLII